MGNWFVRTMVLASFATAASAADVAGLWQASFTPSDGHHHESTLDLQVENGTITGKITSKRGSAAITGGKLKGKNITFTVNRKGNGDDITVTFTGTVENGTMKLNMQYGGREPIPIVAKRTS